MARTFNGTTSIISATIAAVDSGSWSAAAWVYLNSAGEGNAGRVFEVQNGSSVRTQLMGMQTTNRDLFLIQGRATTEAQSITNTGMLALSTWSLFITTYDTADSLLRAYIGTGALTVTECTYASRTAGSGAQITGGTNMSIGNRPAADRTWDGNIERMGFWTRLLTATEMEQLRIGTVPVSNLQNFWPLNSPTDAQLEDVIAGAGGTGTAVTSVVGSGVPLHYTNMMGTNRAALRPAAFKPGLAR